MNTLTFIELAKILISFAICAPSGHNSQPWKFQTTENQIIVMPDMSKTLKVVDGENRELFISLGCAVENMQIAATLYGYESDYEYIDGKIVVTFRQSETVTPDPLLDQIKKRHTHRGEFTGKKIPSDLIKILQSVEKEENTDFTIFDGETNEAKLIKEKIYLGNDIQMSDTAFKNELVEWMRFNKKDIKENQNGLCYNVLGFPATPKFVGKKMVRMFLSPKAQNKTDNGVNNSASAFCLFSTAAKSEADYIAVGKTLERVLLKITELNLAYSFSNQPCEVEPLSLKLREELSLTNYPSVVIRIGYGEEPKHFAPREKIEL
ncbi:MAG: nitroreductase [Bacteroidales bacterium]|nr:nitroreductase [Bacteroidales bacterium]